MQDEDLLEEVARIARHFANADTLDGTLQRIVDQGEAYLEGCDGASVSIIRNRHVSTPVSSNQWAYDNDQAQYAANQGPCLDAIRQEHFTSIDDLETEERWPVWRDRALELGVRSTASFRLFLVDGVEDTMGALNLYSTAAHSFDTRSRILGQVFASHAAVAMKAAITEAGLRQALHSRDVIGQAKGVLMERERLTAEQAFSRLRQLSNDYNQPLREVAADLAETGRIPTT